MITRRALTRLCDRIEAISPSHVEWTRGLTTAEIEARVVNRANLVMSKIDAMIANAPKCDQHQAQRFVDLTARMKVIAAAHPVAVVKAIDALHVSTCRLRSQC